MRELINRYGIGIAVGGLLVAVIVVFVVMRGRPGGADVRQGKAYYVDEDGGVESIRPVTDVPPLKGAGGNATVVLANRITCDGGKTSRVAYLIKYTDAGKAELEKMYASKGQYQPNINIRENTLVRFPENGSSWEVITSDAGERVMGRASCPDGVAKGMVPP